MARFVKKRDVQAGDRIWLIFSFHKYTSTYLYDLPKDTLFTSFIRYRGKHIQDLGSCTTIINNKTPGTIYKSIIDHDIFFFRSIQIKLFAEKVKKVNPFIAKNDVELCSAPVK